jgi:hypothetical protein
MIIGPITETGSSKAVVAREDSQIPPVSLLPLRPQSITHQRLLQDDPPPSYTLSTSSPPPKASNFVAISKSNGHVKGSWTIDPSLLVPTSFLPSLAEHETRKNFSASTNNGVIDLDLTIVPSNNDIIQGEKKRATIYLNSNNGMLTAKLVGPSTFYACLFPFLYCCHCSTAHPALNPFFVPPF